MDSQRKWSHDCLNPFPLIFNTNPLPFTVLPYNPGAVLDLFILMYLIFGWRNEIATERMNLLVPLHRSVSSLQKSNYGVPGGGPRANLPTSHGATNVLTVDQAWSPHHQGIRGVLSQNWTPKIMWLIIKSAMKTEMLGRNVGMFRYVPHIPAILRQTHISHRKIKINRVVL